MGFLVLASAFVPGYLYALWIGGGVAFVLGVGLLAWARVSDRKNYIIQRATPMPLSLVNERDDVWLRGVGETDEPVLAPHFGHPCLVYKYRLEERVRRTRRTKDGKTETYYTWETRETRSDAAYFQLRQSDLSIDVDGNRADFRDLQSTSDRIGNWRHSLSYLRCPCEVSAVGSVSEKRARLEPYANIPLMVTPKPRAEFIRAAEFREKLLRGFGFFLLWAGAVAAFHGLFAYLGWPVNARDQFRWEILATALVPSTVLFEVIWSLYVYNTFVAYRVRVRNAWYQIDVDLKTRYDLIPQLVETAKAYLKHEKELLERIALLRAEAIAGDASAKVGVEGGLVRGLRRFTVLVENYPELKSQPVMEKLMRELRALEEKIGHGRTVYNEAVTEYNDNVQCFPRALLAQLCGFRPRVLFEALEAEREVPAVGG